MKRDFNDIEPGDKIYFFSAGMKAVDGCPAIRSRTLQGRVHSIMPESANVRLGKVWFVQHCGCTLPIGEEDFRGFVEKKAKVPK